MPNIDYNPDKEGHVRKKWEVIKATTKDVQVEVDGKAMPFGRDGAFRVNDPGVADAIRQRYGRTGDVTVTRIRYPDAHDRGHRYFFSMPLAPWKRKVNDAGQAGEELETIRGVEGEGHEQGEGGPHHQRISEKETQETE